jgi:hypothetical protein
MLVFFMDIWPILRPFDIPYLGPFGIFYGKLVYFSPFWYIVPRKIWQPWPEVQKLVDPQKESWSGSHLGVRFTKVVDAIKVRVVALSVSTN